MRPESNRSWSRPGRGRAPAGSRLGRVDLLGAELLDVDVLEGQDLHVLGEARSAVHVPDPRVAHRHLEEHVAALGARLHVDLVAEVEAAVGLYDVLEDPDHVAVLAIERELHLGLVLLEILGAHAVSPRSPRDPLLPTLVLTTRSSTEGSLVSTSSTVGSSDGSASRPAARRTFTNRMRCWGQGPCSSRAALWTSVT